jgi:2-polyprenyl-3-methyl-5-hydroxy-6-metoxy-1,4-benzoquinol methylase
MIERPSAKKMTKTNCISCGRIEAEELIVNERLTYFCCDFCGHCELAASSTRRDTFETAQEKYFSQNLQSLENIPENQDAEISMSRIGIVRSWLSLNSSILEVGPGLGSFARRLSKEGSKVTLVEHSAVLANLLSKEKEFIVYTGEFEKLRIEQDMFDGFCSFHVIEHVVDTQAHLRAGFKIVTPGGIAFVATPNSRSWQQRLFPKLSPNFDSAHLRVFSPFSLKKVCKDAGWEVLYCHTPEYISGWLRVATKILRLARGEDSEETAGKYAGNKSMILLSLLKLVRVASLPLRALQSRMAGGNEIFIILRKPTSSKNSENFHKSSFLNSESVFPI